MKKSYLIMAAIASVALVSCSNEEYFGDPGGLTGERAISFDMSTPAMTRPEIKGEAAAEELGYSFQVYATKTVNDGTNDVISNVFATNDYTNTLTAGANPYWAWYVENTAGKTNSNLNNWEYVGGTGNHGKTGHQITIDAGKDQTIKYWDRSADEYSFMAFKAKTVTSGTATISNVTPSGFTVTGTPDQLAKLYVADKEIVTNNANGSGNVYGSPVRFTFRNFVSKIRFGIYENIPGYTVKIDKVYYDTDPNEKNSNTTFGVTGSFSGNANQSYGFTVTYDTDGRAKGAHSSGTAQNYFETENSTILSADAIGTTATGATYDQAAGAYSIIMPDPNNTTGMTLKVDVTLTSEGGSGETIKLTNASATVPADYCKWKSNFAYTYLFKISDLTQFEGKLLCPITLDAVVVDDGQGEQNTITVVETPSITTYQNGDIVDDYTTTYTPARDIFVTVEDASGALLSLIDGTTQKAALYTFTGNYTEAEIQKALLVRQSALDATTIEGRNGIILTPAKKSGTTDDLLELTNTIVTASGNLNVGNNNAAKFIPATGNYAFVYTQTAPQNLITKHELVAVTAGEDVSNYYRKFKYNEITDATDAQDGETYYTYNATNNTQTVTPLFCGQDATGLYIVDPGNAGQYIAATGKVQTSGAYYLLTAFVPTTENPKTEGLYELSGVNYVLTDDETVVAAKTYFKATSADARLIAFDNFSTTLYKKTGATSYALVTDADLTAGPIAATEYYSDEGTTRVYILPQSAEGFYTRESFDNINGVDETTDYRNCEAGEKAIVGEKYYDRYAQNDGKFAVKVIKVQ